MADFLQRMNIDSVEEVGDTTNLTSYVQRVTIIEVLDQNGDKWEPDPGPDPFDELSNVTKTTTTGNTNIGDTLTGTLAVYAGGMEPVVEQYQWQKSDNGSGGWSGVTNWTEVTGVNDTETTYTITIAESGKYLRFASKATDDSGDTVYGSGPGVGPVQQYTLGTVAPDPAVISAGNSDTLTFNAVIDGGDYPLGSVTYKWDIRSGQATINGSSTQSSCSITVDGVAPGSIQLRVTATAPYGLNSPQAPVALITIVE